MLYKSTQPLATKDAYLASDQVEFRVLLDADQEIVRGSFSVSGKLRVLSSANGTGAAANLTPALDVRYDGKIGTHAFFNSWATQLDNMVLPNTDNYSRYVRMLADSTMTADDMYNSENVVELRVPNNYQSKYLMLGIGRPADANNNAIDDDTPFFNRPLAPFNQTSRNIRITDVREITMTATLSTVYQALTGSDVGPTTVFQLKDLALNYTTVPINQSDKSKLQFRFVTGYPQTIESANANVSFQNAVTSNAVSMSFLKTDHENSPRYNHTETETLPDIERVLISFNDTPTSVLTHELSNLEEVSVNYIDSFQTTGHTDVLPGNFNLLGKCFGVGLNWGGYVNLSNQKFTVQIQSGASNVNQYLVYSYFHSIVEI